MADATMIPSDVLADLTLVDCKNNVFSAEKHGRLNLKTITEVTIKFKNYELSEKVYISMMWLHHC